MRWDLKVSWCSHLWGQINHSQFEPVFRPSFYIDRILKAAVLSFDSKVNIYWSALSDRSRSLISFFFLSLIFSVYPTGSSASFCSIKSYGYLLPTVWSMHPYLPHSDKPLYSLNIHSQSLWGTGWNQNIPIFLLFHFLRYFSSSSFCHKILAHTSIW